MEAHAEHAQHHHHHEMPTEGRALTGVAVSATLHCLTGCAIGEVAGMAIGTALGFSDLGTIALAVALAFLFGYTLTSLPLLRAGLVLSAVIPIALASDTLSIATMEVVDNAIMVIVPGAMEAGLGDILFWGALAFALAVAFVLTVPVNRWLIARGKGHTAVHETGIHGGPPVRVVGAATALAAVFGASVLVAEAVTNEDEGHGGGGHGGTEMAAVATGSSELGLELDETTFPRATEAEFSFRVLDGDGAPVQDYDVEHAKEMHLIVVRNDMTGFQHLHPERTGDGTWSTPLTLGEPGTYRVFADFSTAGESETLTADVTVTGRAEPVPLPAESNTADAGDGYAVDLDAGTTAAGTESELAFSVTRNGEPVDVEPYLGADGHLVVLRQDDLAYLHVHPVTGGGHGSGGGQGGHGEGGTDAGAIRFATEFPTEGNYRLFLQFRDEGEVRTAEFTRAIAG